MKVVKFGGSSLASATQLEKVFNIVKEDETRQYVVVSAPGKRNAEDTKVTDALIKYYKEYTNGKDTSQSQEWIINRYRSITEELDLNEEIIEEIARDIMSLATLPKSDNTFLYDTFLAAGENNNAKLIAAYFVKKGLEAKYIHPKDSDITGSIIAAGVKADLYENFTDVDGIFAAHPGIIKHPHSIPELTYKEMRELAYAGFSVLHDEALVPAYRGKIPMVIKNTNNPKHPGTKIVLNHTNENVKVVGIAGDSGFVSINTTKYLMNREVGFGRKLLQILEDLNISWDHMPTGIDDLSVILRSKELTPIKEQEILKQLIQDLQVDYAEIEHDLSIIMIVGENMKNQIGVTATATKALSENNINIQMISQGSSEVSIMFVVNQEQEKQAIKALYNVFFN